MALATYWAACTEAVQGGVTEALQRQIQQFERDMQTNDWVTKVLPPLYHKLMKDLIDLRWYQILAIVGDWMNLRCTELRIAVKATKNPEHVKSLGDSQQWSAISRVMGIEEQSYIAGKEKEAPTFVAVLEACSAGRMNRDRTMRCVKLYAERNEAFHSGVKEHIKAYEYPTVAQMLHDALADLESICPAEKTVEKQFLKEHFEEMRDTWFKLMVVDNPITWQATDALKALTVRLKTGEQDPAQEEVQEVKGPGETFRPGIATEEEERKAFLSGGRPIPSIIDLEIPTRQQMPPGRKTVLDKKRKVSETADANTRVKLWARAIVGVEQAVIDQEASTTADRLLESAEAMCRGLRKASRAAHDVSTSPPGVS